MNAGQAQEGSLLVEELLAAAGGWGKENRFFGSVTTVRLPMHQSVTHPHTHEHH